jgi:hypothetical protein
VRCPCHAPRCIPRWVAKLYAVELRVGDGVREKSGRGGVARSRPNGRSGPASEDGEAHAWLGPAALLWPASPDLTVVPLGANFQTINARDERLESTAIRVHVRGNCSCRQALARVWKALFWLLMVWRSTWSQAPTPPATPAP